LNQRPFTILFFRELSFKHALKHASTKSYQEATMQHETSHHEAPASGMSQTAVWTLMLLLFGPSALTLWWVIHQSS
jgi:hypothetical protein